MITFENYYALFLFLLIPLFAILYGTKIIRRISLPLTYTDWDGHHYEWKSKRVTFWKGVSFFLSVLGLCLLIIALANPRFTRYEKRYVSRGSEVVFVLDVSPSMSALDVNNKRRIDSAKLAIESVVDSLNGTTFGLVAMGSDASCIVPPTMNQKVFKQKLNQVKLGSLGDGTALGLGISSAVFHLSTSMAPQKIIILITDGENNAGTIHPFTASRLALEQNIPIYVLGIGSKGTVPIEYTDPTSGKTYSGFLESNYDFSSLEKISAISNGKFYEIINLKELTGVIDSIVQNEVVIPHFYTVNVDREYYPLFLLLSGICFVLMWMINRLYLKEVL